MISIQELIDKYLVRITVKPREEALSGKDYSYGYGMPFGVLLQGQFGARPLLDLTQIMQPVSAMMVMGMMGMVVRGALNGGRSGR